MPVARCTRCCGLCLLQQHHSQCLQRSTALEAAAGSAVWRTCDPRFKGPSRCVCSMLLLDAPSFSTTAARPLHKLRIRAEQYKAAELEGFVFYQGRDGSEETDEEHAAADMAQLARLTQGKRYCHCCTAVRLQNTGGVKMVVIAVLRCSGNKMVMIALLRSAVAWLKALACSPAVQLDCHICVHGTTAVRCHMWCLQAAQSHYCTLHQSVYACQVNAAGAHLNARILVCTCRRSVCNARALAHASPQMMMVLAQPSASSLRCCCCFACLARITHLQTPSTCSC